MDKRSWTAAELVRHSGLTKQTVSNVLSDGREQLMQRPKDSTIAGLAKAFGITPDVILSAVAEAMGLPAGERVVVYDADQISDEELLRVLAQRLRGREDGEGHEKRPAPMNQGPQGPHLTVVPEPGPDAGDSGPGVQTARDDITFKHPPETQWTDGVQRNLDELAAREGDADNPPDTTTGEHNQDPGGNDPA
ncbi:helix-turn-helix domain-containing protein [Pseudactinotalea suaedae]|uniref:helix-turn-helix domain-containing protein n=1 Tax=Pseudactinotalea suaedae TaxID=1524924 RepID=UPI001F4FD251|nr:helix-turn-helix transcriptional regulator [Pseudactinotalea suaedae]